MSVKTIECRIVARPETLQYLWELMTQKNTPLINELLAQVPNHPDFEEWLQKGTLPQKAIKDLCAPLRKQEPFTNQPGRFYTSAIALVHYIYKSWFKTQKKIRQKIKAKERWLGMLRSDVELEEDCELDIAAIRLLAATILKQVEDKLNLQKITPKKRRKKRKKTQSKEESTIFTSLFNHYNEATDISTKCAVAYLLKNSCQINEDDEDPEEYALRRRKQEIEIERLKKQLKSRIPLGRDLNGTLWFETLNLIDDNYVPEENVEAKSLQDNLLKKPASVPYPVSYESNTDLTWLESEQNRLYVKFNGLGDHEFEIRCDLRQLDWFRRFLTDQNLKQISKKEKEQGLKESELSSALFALRSGRILWREGKKKPSHKTDTRQIDKNQPGNFHNLYLQCSIDTKLWTTEGTALVAQGKTNKSNQAIAQTQAKGDLDLEQQKHIKRKQTELANLNNLPERPHKTLYRGNPSMVVGVCLGLKIPVTVAIIDVVNNRTLIYRSSKQLLGDDYKLLNRQRREKQRRDHQRHQAQKQNLILGIGESELGKYVDRLFANAIVELAQSYQASSIVLPQLGQIREITQSEVQARAEKKILGYKEGQKKYTKQYQINVHHWSYGRLSEFISQKADRAGIAIETARQSLNGTYQQKAKYLAIAAYQARLDLVI